MNSRHRRIALILAIPGIAACVLAIAAFLLDFLHNRLPWVGEESHRAQYLVLGRVFTRGFVAGFFLCFFLMLVAFSVGTWFDQRREQRKTSQGA
ncbi:MAG: hypothetical protein LAO51_17555 [Acidobacteriia bacterium]|nr:hypothetical protein [Terriglobia bacterium]